MSERFSKNPLWEEAAIQLAERAFGHDWESAVYWEPNINGITVGEWTMTWEVDRESKNFVLTTVFENHHENIDSKTPAHQEYDKHGQLLWREFLTNGKLQNPEPNIAACEAYYPDGSLREKRFCTNGELTDAGFGSPAKTKYYANGVVQEICRMQKGQIRDTEYGEPAVIFYDEGGDISGSMKENAVLLNIAETKIRIEIGKQRRLSELCGDAANVIAGKSSNDILNAKNCLKNAEIL